MSGFKNFILRGNLVDLAVAVIIGAAFGAVVAAFTRMADQPDPGRGTTSSRVSSSVTSASSSTPCSRSSILAAVVYFAVVLPYTRAKERYFPSPEPGTPEDIVLLSEIRDLLKAQQGGTRPTV